MNANKIKTKIGKINKIYKVEAFDRILSILSILSIGSLFFIGVYRRPSAAEETNLKIKDQGTSVLFSVYFRVFPWLIGFRRRSSAANLRS